MDESPKTRERITIRNTLKKYIKRAHQKQIEQALFRSEEKFLKVFRYNPDIIIICTLPDGYLTEVNNTFVELSGYEPNEAIGHTVRDLDFWVDLNERDYALQQVLEKGHIRGFEVRLRNKYGDIRIANASAEITDLEGEPHLICTVRDITDNKRMEEALRLSEEYFSKAFNACPIPMTITTIAEGKLLDCNSAFYSMYTTDRETIIGQISTDMFWIDKGDRALFLQTITDNGSVSNMEIKFRVKSDEKRLGLLSAETITLMGKPCLLSIFVDITELRKMEVEIARLDRLNIVGEMAASIGHEIRNPMTTVRGYLQLMREDDHNKHQTEYYDLMIEELDRANSIITEFLSLAKNKIVNRKMENLNSIITKLFPLIQTKAVGLDHNIQLDLTAVPDLLLNKEEIHQLILNLVYNGLEAMSQAGNVTIKTFANNNEVILAVQDQGPGIDPALQDKLGIPFFSTKPEGTGLGLAVCYRIAARHNALIDMVTNSVGAAFYIRFPIPLGDL